MYAILMVEHTTDKSIWPEELRDIDSNRGHIAGVTKLLSGIWLIELEQGLQTFGILLRCLLSQPNLRYEVAFLKEKPEFVSPSMKIPEQNDE